MFMSRRSGNQQFRTPARCQAKCDRFPSLDRRVIRLVFFHHRLCSSRLEKLFPSFHGSRGRWFRAVSDPLANGQVRHHVPEYLVVHADFFGTTATTQRPVCPLTSEGGFPWHVPGSLRSNDIWSNRTIRPKKFRNLIDILLTTRLPHRRLNLVQSGIRPKPR